MMFRFEKLEVWQEAIAYADDVYKVTAQFPSDELYGLRSQLRRAAVSISANVAEGSSRSSNADFARFVEIAYGSTMETISHASRSDASSLAKKTSKSSTTKQTN